MTAAELNPRQAPDVAAWLAAMQNSADLPTLRTLCDAVEAVDTRLRCSIKWNTPSYFITHHFATTGVIPKGGVRLVLHPGATRRQFAAPLREAVRDPEDLLSWKDADRALTVFRSPSDVSAAAPALAPILSQWIRLTQ